jgi:hypothetical protein
MPIPIGPPLNPSRRLNYGPFIVIGDVQILPDLFHHAFPELGGIKISRSAGAAAVVILGQQISATGPQSGGKSQNT